MGYTMDIRIFVLSLVVTASILASHGPADGPDVTTLREDFESAPTIMAIKDDGMWRIHSCGPTEERAAGGKRSFKVDVEWLDSSWDCWRPLPLTLLYRANPTIRAKLLVDPGSGRLGHPYSTKECGADGLIVAGKQVGSLGGGWVKWEARADGKCGDGEYLQAALLWVRPDANGRTTVYIDDLEVEGSFSPQEVERLSVAAMRCDEKRRAGYLKEIAAIEQRFAKSAKEAARHSTDPPEAAEAAVAKCWRALVDFRRQAEASVRESLRRVREFPTDAGLAEIRRNLKRIEAADRSLPALREYAKSHPGLPYVTWRVKAISDGRVLPKKLPVPGIVADRVRVRGCPGEYEPVTFTVTYMSPGHGLSPDSGSLENLLVEPTDAKCGDCVLPASAIDIRHVKCWWQAGGPIADLTHPSLTPELLLKDPQFVTVDDENQKNIVRDPDSPWDAKTLQPVSVPSGTTHQFWVMVHIPEDLPPGTYEGSLRLTADNAPPFLMPISIEVLPFRLEKPLLRYAIYYRGVLTDDAKPNIHGTGRTPGRYLAEMRNLKAHGITHPTCYEPFGERLDRAIRLRQEAGIEVNPFYSLGFRIGDVETGEELKELAKRIRAARAQLTKHGISELYVYGKDERVGDELSAQRATFETVRKAGGKVFIACYAGAFELIGDLVDHANHSGPPNAEEAKKWHSVGHKVFNYGNPQSGVPLPEVYRRNYGLALWKLGYDGAMDWAFCGVVGNAWNDSDHFKYRDICFVYPTVDGVIDTIAWEGFREGVDDVRYLSTLLAAIEKAKEVGHPLAGKAEEWVRSLDLARDLDQIRGEMIEWIRRLSE